jgi:hypothetical protein
MADAPGARPRRLVIPLHPDRPASAPRFRVPAALRAAAGRLRVPAELAVVLRMSGRGTLEFLAPALFLALGTTLLALLGGSVAGALGVRGFHAAALATTAGRWTLLASTGCALAWRGCTLARARWR